MRREKCEYFFCEGCVDVVLAVIYAMLSGNEKFAFFDMNRSIGPFAEWH